MHVFPRYTGDNFNQELTKKSFLSDPGDRVAYVKELKKYLEENHE